MMEIEAIIKRYYDCWINNQREAARSMLADDMIFRSPSDNCDGADNYLETCWQYAPMLNSLDLVQEAYGPTSAYIAYRIGTMTNGEFITIDNGKITSIKVTFNVTD